MQNKRNDSIAKYKLRKKLAKANFKKKNNVTATMYLKKTKIHSKQKSMWKFQAVFLTSLIIIILVIPTIIVVAFGKGEDQNEVTSTTEEFEGMDDGSESPLSVEVMRSKLDTIEDVPLETYIVGVVASEMSAGFEMEALKAQALAARTLTVNYLLNPDKTLEYDITDTVNHQVYKNEQELREQWGSDFSENIKKIKEAVAATEGEILTYNDSPIFPAFFSTSNGYTENSEDYWENELPYLRSVKSPWDEASPEYLNQKTFSLEQVETALKIDLPNNKPIAIKISLTDGKRVNNVSIDGNEFSGREVRDKLKLRSSDFTTEQKNNHLIFTTKGYGHGIGMSQYGANGMAKEGKNYKDIVNYFYKDIKISTVNDTAPTLVAK